MNNKRKIILAAIGVVVSTALLVMCSILAEEEIINTANAITLTTVSTGLVLVAVFYASRVDYETSVYKCRKCGHTFKPNFKEYIFGAHTLTTRHLKCPKCEEKSWCRRKSIN